MARLIKRVWFFVRDLEISTLVGVLKHEKNKPQRIVISAELRVMDNVDDIDDRYENVICYGGVIELIKNVCAMGHVNLLETLAEKIAARLLLNPRILAIRVVVEKPDIFDDCGAVGVAIERQQTAQ